MPAADALPTSGPVYIWSVDNDGLAFTVEGGAAGPVTLAAIAPGSWNEPFSQWVLEMVSPENQAAGAPAVYKIGLYSSNSQLYLEASGAAADAPITVAAASTSPTQLWSFEAATAAAATCEPYWLTSPGAPGFDVGFPGDFPVPGIPMTLQAGHTSHLLGDNFSVSAAFSQ